MNMTNAENACIDESISPKGSAPMCEDIIWRELSRLNKNIRFAGKSSIADYLMRHKKLIACEAAINYASYAPAEGGPP
jgi:hypothetical protein